MSCFDVLIGASGLLGSHLSFSRDTLLPLRSQLDIADRNSVYDYFSNWKRQSVNINTIILSAAYTNVAKSNLEMNLVYRTNVLGPQFITEVLHDLNIRCKLVYISSDYVFSGDEGYYTEQDPVNPVKDNYYALSKALGEHIVRGFSNYLIIRTSFCRSDIWPYKKAFLDQYTSRDTVDVIAPMISSLININASGIVHIGTERKSVFDLARRINSNIEPMSRLEIEGVNIPYDTSLISTINQEPVCKSQPFYL